MLRRVTAFILCLWLVAGNLFALPPARCSVVRTTLGVAHPLPCCCGTGSCKMKSCPSNTGTGATSGHTGVCTGCGVTEGSPTHVTPVQAFRILAGVTQTRTVILCTPATTTTTPSFSIVAHGLSPLPDHMPPRSL